ncbi:hypothetical protein FQ042_23940 [Escherichia coli]|nr:hypothetical protein [Escherichia coli]
MNKLCVGLAALCLAGASQAKDYKPWSETKVLTYHFSFPQKVGVKATTTGLTKDPRILDGGSLVAFAVTNGSEQDYPAGYVGLAVQPQYIGEGGAIELHGDDDNKIVGKVEDNGQWEPDPTNAGRWLTKRITVANQESAELRIVAAGQQTVAPGEYKIAVSAVHRTE